MRLLLLVGTERPELALRGEDALDGLGAERADQLVLEIGVAHVEAEALHVFAREVRAEPGALERPAEGVLLARVAQPCQPHAPLRAPQPSEERPDRLRAADRHDGDALSVEVVPPPLRERFERRLVARTFHQHDGAWIGGQMGQVAHDESVGV